MDITLGYRGNLYLKPGYRIFRSNTMQDTLNRGNFDLNQDTGYSGYLDLSPVLSSLLHDKTVYKNLAMLLLLKLSDS